MSRDVVQAEGVSKRFKLYRRPWHRLAEWGTGGRAALHHPFWALRDVSLSLPAGSCLGIIGSNGAGKSTLLKILSGVLQPTSGRFRVEGRVVSLLELGIGFHPELSGLENVFTSARLLGFRDDWTRARLERMLDFAELGEFVERPVKTYSSGMYVRLAFSLFAFLEPDVYIVDEALAVGDVFFQQKCFHRLAEMRQEGAAILLVSHDMGAVNLLCDRALLLSHGRMASEGDPVRVVHDYFASLGESDYGPAQPAHRPGGAAAGTTDVPPAAAAALRRSLPAHARSHPGTRRAEIAGFAVTDAEGRLTVQTVVGETLRFWILARGQESVDDLHVGLHLYDRRGVLVYAIGSANRGLSLPALEPAEEIVCQIAIRLDVAPGEYTLVPQLGGERAGRADPGVLYDRLERPAPITILPADPHGIPPFYGVAALPTTFALARLTDGAAG